MKEKSAEALPLHYVWLGTRGMVSVEAMVVKESAGELRLAGIFPGSEPVGADVGGGAGKLMDQRGSGLIIKAVVVFVVVGLAAEMRVAVGEKNRFDPGVGGEAGLEGMIGGIADEGSVVGAHREEGSEAVDQRGAEALVDSILQRQVTVEIFGAVEGIMRFGDVSGKDRGVESRLVPFA